MSGGQPGDGQDSVRLARCRSRFLEGHFAHWPSEATTLGLRERDHELKDLSEESVADELDLHRQSLSALRALDTAALDAEERLDVEMMTALSEFHLHVVGERQEHLVNIEMSLHPYLMVQLQQRDARDVERFGAISERVSAVPRFLDQQRTLLERGAAAGRSPDVDAVAFIADNQLPRVVEFFGDFERQPAGVGVELDAAAQREFTHRCRAAAEAYAEHAVFLRDRVGAVARRRVLGADEYAWRLETSLGVRATPAELIERAHGTLAELRDELMTTAGIVRGGVVRDTESALALVMRERQRPLAAADDDVIPAYRRVLTRACAHMSERSLFHVGGELEALALLAPPPAFAELGPVTNVAAPLLDDAGRAAFLIQPEAGLHPHIQGVLLAVHEGIPGHGLQSIWWQQHPEGRPDLVRFLCVPDDVAFARQYFGAMMNIEGWATYAEHVMREHDFFTPDEALWAIWAQMAHAARAVVDASLHTGRMSVEDGVSFLSEELGLARAWAEGEVLRYRRIPLQALCYMLGRLELIDLRERCRAEEGAASSLADFHERVFAAGPVAAGHLSAAWFGP